MRLAWSIVIATAAAGVSHADERGYGDYHALVIGNDAYQHQPELKTAVRDARAVAALLRESYGFQVTLEENTTFRELRGALWSFRKELGPTDNLLV
jgi:uncharacterized caspase-like protein